MRTFTFQRADNVRAAIDALHAREGAYLAGGTNLLDLMKLDVMRPPHLVAIDGARGELGRIVHSAEYLDLGALVRMSEAADDPLIRAEYPVISDALWQAASPQLRNMATLGGNVLQRTRCNYFRGRAWAACNKRNPGSGCAAMDGCNRRLAVLGVSDHCIASYPGDFAQALVALRAEVRIASAGGSGRTMPFEQLHLLPGDTPHRETVLQPGELILGFRVPAGPWTRRSRYVKVRDRTSYDFALASAAVALDLTDDGRVRHARIALGGLATVPWRAAAAEQELEGRLFDVALAERAATRALAGAIAHGENEFKIELGRRTLVRALLEARAMGLT